MQSATDSLPDLHQATLDPATVEQLFRDIESCAQLTELIPKFAARGHVPAASALTLSEARDLLLTRQLRALQLRYRHDGSDWWDTLQALPDGFRLVRIQHHVRQEPLAESGNGRDAINNARVAVPPPAS